MQNICIVALLLGAAGCDKSDERAPSIASGALEGAEESERTSAEADLEPAEPESGISGASDFATLVADFSMSSPEFAWAIGEIRVQRTAPAGWKPLATPTDSGKLRCGGDHSEHDPVAEPAELPEKHYSDVPFLERLSAMQQSGEVEVVRDVDTEHPAAPQ